MKNLKSKQRYDLYAQCDYTLQRCGKQMPGVPKAIYIVSEQKWTILSTLDWHSLSSVNFGAM